MSGNPLYPPQDLSDIHLQAEFARMDLLIQQQVLRWQLAGQDMSDTFRGLYVSDSEANALLNRPLGGNWGQASQFTPEQKAWFDRAHLQAAERCQAVIKQAAGQGVKLRWLILAETFGLDAFDLDILLVCLLPSLDLRYERLYGYLQDDVTRRRPSVNLVLDLLCPPGPQRLKKLSHFSSHAPLFHHRLLEKNSPTGAVGLPLLSQVLSVDESVVAWLLGEYQPHVELSGMVQVLTPQPFAMSGEWQSQILPVLDQASENPPVMVFHGPDQTGQDAAAHLLAQRLGLPLMTIDLSLADRSNTGENVDREPLLRLALRDARLAGALPYIRNWDSCLVDGIPPARLLAAVCNYPGAIITAGRVFWRAGGIDRPRPLTWIAFDIPAYPERLKLWEHYLQQAGARGQFDTASLAGQFQLTLGQIRDAVASARDWAVQAGEPLENGTLFAAARLHSNPRLSSLARKLQPRYGWDDIVLPNDQLSLLHEIINTVRQRPRVLDDWGVGSKLASSRGVTVLFAGPPGTGKTMAAEVIAGELGLDLYKIDLSTVVSKYIGETEKNLERIFNEAETSNAILFFDEADSLFGKRSEVRDSHDRYANIEISYLLQRMEAYDGVTMLATNLRANLDEAFTRRLQFAVDFPFPEEADRLRIWKTLFPPDVPCETDVDLGLLARRFKLAGGNIRNIIVSAAYLAAADGGTVNMTHLLHGTRRELQKMGRLVSEGDMILE